MERGRSLRLERLSRFLERQGGVGIKDPNAQNISNAIAFVIGLIERGGGESGRRKEKRRDKSSSDLETELSTLEKERRRLERKMDRLLGELASIEAEEMAIEEELRLLRALGSGREEVEGARVVLDKTIADLESRVGVDN